MTKAQVVNSESGEIVEAHPRTFDDAVLGAMTSFGDALKALTDAGMVPTDITEYGTGFEVVSDKSTLVGVPFLALTWSFREGDHGQYVSVVAMTKDGRKLIINDGSTGIKDQLIRISEDRLKEFKGEVTKAHSGLLCPKGLRRSDFTYVDAEGKTKNATTFYLAM